MTGWELLRAVEKLETQQRTGKRAGEMPKCCQATSKTGEHAEHESKHTLVHTGGGDLTQQRPGAWWILWKESQLG